MAFCCFPAVMCRIYGFQSSRGTWEKPLSYCNIILLNMDYGYIKGKLPAQ